MASVGPVHTGISEHTLKPAFAGSMVAFLEGWPAGIVQFLARLWMASIFFRSGLLKIQNFDGAVFLFTEVHPVPLLPPALAAAIATTFELACPMLLALGLLTRLAALPMLGMTLVIQFVIGARDPSFWQVEHYYWMFLLAFLVVKGAGPISLDLQWLTRRYGIST